MAPHVLPRRWSIGCSWLQHGNGGYPLQSSAQKVRGPAVANCPHSVIGRNARVSSSQMSLTSIVTRVLFIRSSNDLMVFKWALPLFSITRRSTVTRSRVAPIKSVGDALCVCFYDDNIWSMSANIIRSSSTCPNLLTFRRERCDLPAPGMGSMGTSPS